MALGVVHERCGGLDVHKKTVVVAVNVLGREETRTFGTETPALLALVEWLLGLKVTVVAMEATGSYWKPVYNLLEAAGIEVTVGNAAHMKAVPGRKTDVNDAQWICDLHRHGLIQASFIPARPQRELRELVRYRISLIDERAAEANRIQKVLEGGNIKLGSVATDILGKSARAMLESIAAGESDPEALAELALGKLRSKHDELVAALQGRVNSHQRQMLRMQLDHVAFLDAQIIALDAEVARRLDPFEKELERLDTIPGVKRRTAEVILAECGTDMSRFPSAAHLVSWAGLCPASNESGGKRRSSRTRKGNSTLRRTMTQAGQAAGRGKHTYLGASYRRIAVRRGGKKAAIAIGRSILEIAYYVLRDGVQYKELGANYYDERKKAAVIRSTIKRLEQLGCKVSIEAA